MFPAQPANYSINKNTGLFHNSEGPHTYMSVCTITLLRLSIPLTVTKTGFSLGAPKMTDPLSKKTSCKMLSLRF